MDRTIHKILEDKNLLNLKNIFFSIEQSHIGLGKLFLFDYLCELANECLLVVGSPATGKSISTTTLFNYIPRAKLKLDAITVSGLRKIAKELSNNTVSIIVDDLSKGQTVYSQIATVSVLSGLVYSGTIVKITQQLNINIINFKGSAIINLQPLLLKKIINLDEFETDIRDKAIRYYHLHFPINEQITQPKLNNKLVFKYVDEHLPLEIKDDKLLDDTLENFRYEFSKARAKEHMMKLLSASALANNRKKILDSDIKLLHHYSKLYRLENELFRKRHLEGKRKLNVDILPLISILNSYEKLTIDDLRIRFGLSKARTYEIISELSDYVLHLKGKSLLRPTEKTYAILKEIGEL